MVRESWKWLAVVAVLGAAGLVRGAVRVEDLPLIDAGVSAYQVSSHNKKGLNGDGGWYLYDGEVIPETLAGWVVVDEGARVGYSGQRRQSGRGALVHGVSLVGLESGWRSIRKSLSGGLNFGQCDRLVLQVWPSHADGGVDYAVRLDSGGVATQLEIRDLKAGRWNEVVLELGDAPREGVESLWLLFRVDWGAEEGMEFFVDGIRFLGRDGSEYVVDDFETGRRRAVLFDAVGPGLVQTIWSLGGHDIRIEADGRVIVDAGQEEFFRGLVAGFPGPLVSQAMVASGPWQCVSHCSFVPIGFRQWCRITTDHPTPFYHVIAERYRDAGRVEAWSPDQELAGLTDLYETVGADPKGWAGLREVSGEVELAAGGSVELAGIEGAGAIAEVRISSAELAGKGESLWLCMDWDGRENEVEAPLAFFFGGGGRWRDVASSCMGIEGETGYSYFPMPFWAGARIRLENRGAVAAGAIGYAIRWRGESYPAGRAGYFRGVYREGRTELGRDWVLLEASGRGQMVGVVQRLIGGHYCEGDIRFYIDGSRSPSFYGTGTEDYYHQACWPNRDNHSPFHGSVGDVAEEAERAGGGRTFYDFPAVYYRVHLDAPVRFQSGLRAGIEHGGVNDTESEYASLAFYYGLDGGGLRETDRVEFGGAVREVCDYFEGDDDDVAVRVRLLETDGAVSRRLAIDPGNEGVRLRRVFDQSGGSQRAAVYVDGEYAGVWYDAGVNVYKRLAESDFEVAGGLTRGKGEIEVTVRPEGVWSVGELRVYSYVVSR